MFSSEVLILKIKLLAKNPTDIRSIDVCEILVVGPQYKVMTPDPPYHIILAPGLLPCKNSKVEIMQQPFEVRMSLMLRVSYSNLALVT